jgi:hypothetical protein
MPTHTACRPCVDRVQVREKWDVDSSHKTICMCDRNGVIDKSELRNLLEAVSSNGEASTAQGWAVVTLLV